jgi:hypothetical protein
MKNIIILILCLSFYSCGGKDGSDGKDGATPVIPVTPSPIVTDEIQSNDILVVDTQADAVFLFSNDGVFKKIIFDVDNAAESIYGIAYDNTSKEVLVSVNGADRVMGISVVDLSTRIRVANINLVGTPLRGLTVLNSGDILVAEDATVERFLSDGQRVNNASWPKTGSTGISQLTTMADGSFLTCAATTSRHVIKRDASGNNPVTLSFSARALDVNNCLELSNGNIVVSLNHATNTSDIVEVYGPTLTGAALFTYLDYNNFNNPMGIVQKSDGNLLVSDNTQGVIVELSENLDFVGIFPYPFGNPGQMLVIP